MNTCDTCINWDKSAPHDGIHGLAICDRDRKIAPGEILDMAENEWDVVNGEPYNAGVIATGPKFGCIHWQRRV